MEHPADQLLDAAIFDTQGDRIGTVTDVYVDEGSGQPEWLLLDTGFFGRGIHVPAHRLMPHEDGYRLPYARDVIESSPEVDAGSDELGEVDERELDAYYGVLRGGGLSRVIDAAAERPDGRDDEPRVV